MRICYDPGHAGRGIEPGAVGPTGLLECDVVPSVCKILKELSERDGHEVLLTRESESDAASDSLRYRTDMSNDWGADIFVSVHCNSATTPAAHGTETYYFPFSAKGRELAEHVHKELIGTLARADRGIKAQNLWVIRYTYCPAILVELMFINNPEEEILLADVETHRIAAEAIYRGVLSFAGIHIEEPQKPRTDEIQAQQEQPPQPIESREDWSDAGLRNRMNERG